LRRFVPILRADLELAASYAFEPAAPLRCPVTALSGRADKTAARDDVAYWGELTAGPFTVRELPGEHFFIHSELATLAQLITTTVE
jgi:medium-chain acyl-[acyl-carrier-protein] hydrolase